MTLDIKLFAPVARATNAIYMYVIDTNDTKSPAKNDKWAQVKAAGYFNNANIVGSVKAGDIVLVNDGTTFGILKITAVDTAAKTVTTAVATLGS